MLTDLSAELRIKIRSMLKDLSEDVRNGSDGVVTNLPGWTADIERLWAAVLTLEGDPDRWHK